MTEFGELIERAIMGEKEALDHFVNRGVAIGYSNGIINIWMTSVKPEDYLPGGKYNRSTTRDEGKS